MQGEEKGLTVSVRVGITIIAPLLTESRLEIILKRTSGHWTQMRRIKGEKIVPSHLHKQATFTTYLVFQLSEEQRKEVFDCAA